MIARCYADRAASLQLRRVGVITGERVEVRVEEREANLHGFTTLAFAAGIAFWQMLALAGSACRLKEVLDKIVCDPRAFEIERIREFLRLGHGKVSDGGVCSDSVPELGLR